MSQLKHYLWRNVILCTKMDTSLKIIHHNHENKELLDEISLYYEERFIRRKKLRANNGTEFLVKVIGSLFK